MSANQAGEGTRCETATRAEFDPILLWLRLRLLQRPALSAKIAETLSPAAISVEGGEVQGA